MDSVYPSRIDAMARPTAVRIHVRVEMFDIICGVLDDGADEPLDCVNVTCPSEYFKCPLSGKCIAYERVCDNIDDCPIVDRINGISAEETGQACSRHSTMLIVIQLTLFSDRFGSQSSDKFNYAHPTTKPYDM